MVTAHGWSDTLGSKSQQVLVKNATAMWVKKVWLQCWPSWVQQVPHQRWIWGNHCTQSRSTCKPEDPSLALKLTDRRHQKFKTGISMSPQKGLMLSKKFKKEKKKRFGISHNKLNTWIRLNNSFLQTYLHRQYLFFCQTIQLQIKEAIWSMNSLCFYIIVW